MADDTRWSPTEVRGLVNDIFKWVLLGLSLFLGMRADQKSNEAITHAQTVASDLNSTQIILGVKPPKN